MITAETLNEALAAHTGRMSVALPARVVTYDAASSTCTAEITVQFRSVDPDTGAVLGFRPRPLAKVPVVWPGNASHALRWPLSAGDPLLLVVVDRSTTRWRRNGLDEPAEGVAPDPRRFSLNDAVAIPGLVPPGDPRGSGTYHGTAAVLSGAEIRLGSSAASAYVALANLVDARLTALENWATAHFHIDPLSGTTGIPTVPAPSGSSTAASNVKAV